MLYFLQTDDPLINWYEKNNKPGHHLTHDDICNYSKQILMVSIHMHTMVSVHVHTMVSVHVHTMASVHVHTMASVHVHTMVSVHVHTMVSVHVHTMVSVHRASAHCTGQGSLPWGMSKLATSLWRGTIVN